MFYNIVLRLGFEPGIFLIFAFHTLTLGLVTFARSNICMKQHLHEATFARGDICAKQHLRERHLREVKSKVRGRH